MKIIYGLGPPKQFTKPVVLAIGVFDGLHLGHQKLIRAMVSRARELKCSSAVMTFHPHPVQVLHPEIPFSLIVSLKHRLALIAELGVNLCQVISFTKRFSRLKPEDFIRTYIAEGMRVKEIFVGDDFRFGLNRVGTVKIFQGMGRKYGFTVRGMTPLQGRDHKISSTDIRNFISAGLLRQAHRYLGRPVSVMGVVRRGDQRGQTLGFPTVNLYPQNEVLPPRGVYAVRVILNHHVYSGMANLGRRPTFPSQQKGISIEAHIFDFHKSLYGKNIIIQFIQKLRDERVFLSREKLIAQLVQDAKASKAILRKKSTTQVRSTTA